jgi:FkbM family methyltransferase
MILRGFVVREMKRLRYLWRAVNYRFRVTPREIEFLGRQLRPGDTAVDVGCHKGGFLFWLRRYVTASGTVYGFEPQPQLARYLKEIVAMQRWDNVVVEPRALSSSNGSMDLFVPASRGHTSGSASLSASAREEPGHRIRVPVVTLDDYFANRGASRIACIKCDCEGHELEVFKGAAGILQRDRPVLLFECERRHLPGSSPAAVFDYLRGCGYRGFFFGPAGLMPLAQFHAEIHQPARPGRFWNARDYYNNFAFLPDSPMT